MTEYKVSDEQYKTFHEDGLGYFCVLWFDEGDSPLQRPLNFTCWANDADHAEEQLIDAEPHLESDKHIVWVYGTSEHISEQELINDAETDWVNWGVTD